MWRFSVMNLVGVTVLALAGFNLIKIAGHKFNIGWMQSLVAF
jgi:hypothetical protein